MRRKSFATNTLLFRKGEPGEAMMLIMAGQVRIFMNDDQGNEITFRTLGAGQILGEFSLLDRKTSLGVGSDDCAAGGADFAACRFFAPAA